MLTHLQVHRILDTDTCVKYIPYMQLCGLQSGCEVLSEASQVNYKHAATRLTWPQVYFALRTLIIIN